MLAQSLVIGTNVYQLKFNNRTVPNKKLRLGKKLKINNHTAYDYFDS